MVGTKRPEYAASTVTIQLTDACNLNCSYCYEINKGTSIMTEETGKKIIDLLFKLYDEDDPNMPINKQIDTPILFFFGGEPLLNVPLIETLSAYFDEICEKRNHPWKEHHIFRICSNGTLYFQPEFQSYLQKYKDEVYFEISIDGSKEMHEASRIATDEESKYDTIIRAIKHYTEFKGETPQLNIVISPENLPYLNQVYDFLLDLNCTNFGLGAISDHKWTIEEAQLYYQQMKILAERMLERPKLILPLFVLDHYQPTDRTSHLSGCTGTTRHGLVFTPEGKAYTCMRFAPCSLPASSKHFCIGDCNGIYNTEEIRERTKSFTNIIKLMHYPQQCRECSIAMGCNKCAAIIYQETGGFLDLNCDECWIQRASALAVSYFWNMSAYLVEGTYRMQIPINKELALKIISEQEYELLSYLASVQE